VAPTGSQTSNGNVVVKRQLQRFLANVNEVYELHKNQGFV